MATSKIIYVKRLKTSAQHINSSNEIMTDAPTDNHGEGKYFSPTDLAATSLGSCMITIMDIYANNSNWELGEIEADLTKVMGSNPRRIIEIQIEIHWKTNLDDDKIAKLKEMAINCPVAKSLHPDVNQNVNFHITKV